MKIFLLFFFTLHHSAFAAGRDCLKEAHDFQLASKVSTMWNSQLDGGEKTIAQICKAEELDIESTIYLNNIVHKKGLVEYARKHTYSMGEGADIYFEDLEGEVSNDELCKALDKYIKETGDCTSPSNYLIALKIDAYKNLEKICLNNLPEQKKRFIACRKQK